jgi:alpha-maltose-1-phosphate synthase
MLLSPPSRAVVHLSTGLQASAPDGQPATAILVSHPHGAEFAVGVARALARTGKLAGLVSGVAFRDESLLGRLAARFATKRPVLANRILKEIPPGRLISLAPVELAARFVGPRLRGLSIPATSYDAIFTAHDAVVARIPWPAQTTGVYAYEDGALFTFRRAARRGLDRVWDLPLPHYLTIEEVLKAESRRWPDAGTAVPFGEPLWKRARKDEELALATKVSVASGFTKRSLERLDLGAPVVVVPYGFPVHAFAERARPPGGPFTVLSVGTHDLRKGTPYLLEAWRRAAISGARLHLVGPMRLSKTFVDRYAGLFTHWPHVPKVQLSARYAEADLVLFPTLGDGFGLVIQESMSCGTPVLTTPCGGGPECITDDVDGWVVPPRDIDALVDRLRQAASDRDRLFGMGRAARARAEKWTWRKAGDALAAALET